MEPKWLEWAKQLQSAAQAGLTYSKDIYDIERFEEIRKISVDIMAHYTGIEKRIIKDVFAGDTGYPTPKVDIRAAVFKDQSILMVKEKSDGRWALPGGWADIGISPGEAAVKEVKEESGIDVKPVKLLAVMDKKCHPHPPSAAHVYKVFIKCEIIGGQLREGTETSAAAFFAETELPPLSAARNTESQIERMFAYLKHPDKPVYFD
ncbi:NUDIX hydrolase [Bacillus amyloliquefaciens]|uniref:NUDIX hydrolase n=1 Tax=Bacillus amyloliquefaciens TaxID=1390 RepID=UPI003A89A8D6